MSSLSFKGVQPEGRAPKQLEKLLRGYRSRDFGTACLRLDQGHPILQLGSFSSPVRFFSGFLARRGHKPWERCWVASENVYLAPDDLPTCLFTLHNCGDGGDGDGSNDDVALIVNNPPAQMELIFLSGGSLDAVGTFYFEEILENGTKQAWMLFIWQMDGRNSSATFCGSTDVIKPIADILIRNLRDQVSGSINPQLPNDKGGDTDGFL